MQTRVGLTRHDTSHAPLDEIRGLPGEEIQDMLIAFIGRTEAIRKRSHRSDHVSMTAHERGRLKSTES
jgi:hypothetical protein